MLHSCSRLARIHSRSASTSPESPTTLSGQAPIPTGLSDDYPRPQGARTDAAADVSPPPNIEGGADVKHDDAHGDGYQDEEDDEGRKERKKKSLKGEQARQLQKEHTSHTAHRKVSTGAPRNIITQPAQKMAM